MIDVHCHLNFNKFESDVDEVIKRARKAGITKIINVGTQIDSSEHAVALAEQYEDLYAIVGVHPHHADKLTKGHLPSGSLRPERSEGSHGIPDQVRNDNLDWIKQLEAIAEHEKVLAIGEIGMDYYSYQSNGIVDPKIQKEVFEAQIVLAARKDLPLQIHNRQAGKDIIEILINHKSYLLNPPGMFHCMSGDIPFLNKVLEMGFYVGFDGNITYEGIAPGETVSLKELVDKTPLERIVIETDSTYLTPLPHRGKRNEPSYAIITAQFIADLKGLPIQKVVEQTDKNVYTIFKKLKAGV